MAVHFDRIGNHVRRHRVTLLTLSVTACLLCGLAAAIAVAGSAEETKPEPPVYLDSAEGYKRLEQSESLQSFVPLSMFFVTQVTQTYCGIASSTMVLNALIPAPHRPVTPEWKPYGLFAQSNFFTREVLKYVSIDSVKDRGLTLDKLAEALGTYPVGVTAFHAGGTNDESAFRTAARKALKGRDTFVILNYLRTAVGQVTAGHFSPLGAYHEPSDSFLVFDVARYKYAPSWVKTKDLWNAMHTVDSDSKLTRGYLLVRKSAH